MTPRKITAARFASMVNAAKSGRHRRFRRMVQGDFVLSVLVQGMQPGRVWLRHASGAAHSLDLESTDLARVNAHWSGFVRSVEAAQ